MLFPEPLIIEVGDPPPSASPKIEAWTTYVTPPATWDATALPVVIAFGEGALLPGISLLDASAALDVSTRAWSTVACTDVAFSIAAPRTIVGDGGGDGRNDVIVHLGEWPAELGVGAVAHTVIRVAGDRILEADIHLNAKDYVYALGARAGASDLRAVLTHELGHLVGIGHTDVSRATMNAGLPSGIAARSLEDDDRAAICALYPATTPSEKGCDHRSPCPAAYSCVGHACEIASEQANLGAACDDVSHAPDRCDGAGDHAPCLATSVGERCVVRCATDGACGSELHCVTIDGDAWCVPLDAAPLADAGTDASIADGGSDAGDASPSAVSDRSGGCATHGGSSSSASGSWLFALAFSLLMRWRR